MNIIYPPLVEQAYRWAVERGFDVSKDVIYRMQVEQGMITETGEPTKKAIDEGIVAGYQREHATLKEFKNEYPIFSSYNVEQFTQQEGIWYVSQMVLNEIVEKLEANQLDYDEKQQLEVYMNFRNYDNPHSSIAETKGVYHPWYTPYDDSLFEIVNGKVAVSQSIIEDMARRAECGELDLDAESLREMIKQMEQQ